MTRVMVFGTFDMIHPGHIEFFRQAKMLAPNSYLIVSVARDKNVTRVKGTSPQNPEAVRLAEVKKQKNVDEVMLGDEQGYVEHIIAARPDIVALGYDQVGEYVKDLASNLEKAGLSVQIVRLKPHEPERYKTSKLRK